MKRYVTGLICLLAVVLTACSVPSGGPVQVKADEQYVATSGGDANYERSPFAMCVDAIDSVQVARYQSSLHTEADKAYVHAYATCVEGQAEHVVPKSDIGRIAIIECKKRELC